MVKNRLFWVYFSCKMKMRTVRKHWKNKGYIMSNVNAEMKQHLQAHQKQYKSSDWRHALYNPNLWQAKKLKADFKPRFQNLCIPAGTVVATQIDEQGRLVILHKDLMGSAVMPRTNMVV